MKPYGREPLCVNCGLPQNVKYREVATLDDIQEWLEVIKKLADNGGRNPVRKPGKSPHEWGVQHSIDRLRALGGKG